MPDNTTLNAATVPGGDIIRSELIAGAKFQAVKIALGVVDSFDADVSSTNPMPVTFSGTLSTNNVSTTPLGGGATFTGGSDDTLAFSAILISVFADQASASNGFSIEFSSDNVNWDSITSFTINASTPYDLQITPKARYFRIVYTNGGVAQTAFRLQTIFKLTSPLPVSEAGKPASGAISVQGISGMTPVQVAGSLTATLANLVSTNNSTTALLGSNAVFTGTGDDVSAYSAIEVFVFTDQISATNGLQLEYSTDNTNWDQVDAYSISISTPFYIQMPPKARYFRIIYTNGAVAQGVFRLQTIYKSAAELPVSQVGIANTTALTVQGNDNATPIPVKQTTPSNLKAQVEYLPTTGQLTSAKIDIATSGDNTIIAGVLGQTIKVYQIMFICASPVNVTPKNGATALTGVLEFLTNGGMVLDFNGEPWFLTSSGNDFILNLSGNVQVSGRIYYIQS